MCKGALSLIRDIYNHITPTLEKILGEVLTITGAIRTAENKYQTVINLIPAGAYYEGILNKALDVIEGTDKYIGTLAEKIEQWLDGKTQIAVNGNLLKLASVAASIAHAEQEPQATFLDKESYYDSAAQIHIMVTKAA